MLDPRLSDILKDCRASAMLPALAPSDWTERKTGNYAEIAFVRSFRFSIVVTAG